MSEKSDKVSKKSKEVNAELESLFKEEDSDYIRTSETSVKKEKIWKKICSKEK